MKQIQLNLNKCKNINDIYQEIKAKFKLPQNCGENLDALWDSLRCYTDEPMIVEVYGIKELSNELREYMESVFEVFADVHEESPNITFEYK